MLYDTITVYRRRMLIQRRSVIKDKLAFPDLLVKSSNIWSFMLFSGYLKASDPVLTSEDLIEYESQIPNREVKTVYRTIIQSWIDGGPVKNDRLVLMLQVLHAGDIEYFEEILNENLHIKQSILIDRICKKNNQMHESLRSIPPDVAQLFVCPGVSSSPLERKQGNV